MMDIQKTQTYFTTTNSYDAQDILILANLGLFGFICLFMMDYEGF